MMKRVMMDRQRSAMSLLAGLLLGGSALVHAEDVELLARANQPAPAPAGSTPAYTPAQDDETAKKSKQNPAFLFIEGLPLPEITSAQFTMIRQNLRSFDSPYSGPLSLNDHGSTKSTYTAGVYLGWEPVKHTQFYLDFEKFQGEGISNATGLASLTDGDAVRAGASGLSHRVYTARAYVRQLIPLGDAAHDVQRSQDQVTTSEPDTRIELKGGIMAVSDDFDHNRYANSTRTQFQNWSLFNNTAWDFAADTRGYTTGVLVGYVSPVWAARLGVYKMPQHANGQPLAALSQARGQNFEVSWTQPKANGAVVRFLVYQNVATMGDYNEAILQGQLAGQAPDIQSDGKHDRHKNGVALNAELPLADDGETGLFTRLGWNDGHTESFAFTEMDRVLSVGAQVDGAHWGRGADRVGIAYVLGGLSSQHRAYLEAGGQGFVLGDGQLNYGSEQVLEAYYRFEPIKGLQWSPDVQYIVNPGFNRDRGPASVYGIRLHLEY